MLMFFSIGFVPLDQYPDWLQPIVEHQPVSYTIEAMRGLSLERADRRTGAVDGGVVGGHRRGVRGAAGASGTAGPANAVDHGRHPISCRESDNHVSFVGNPEAGAQRGDVRRDAQLRRPRGARGGPGRRRRAVRCVRRAAAGTSGARRPPRAGTRRPLGDRPRRPDAPGHRGGGTRRRRRGRRR